MAGMKRFLEWMFSGKPAGELLPEDEKRAQGNKAKKEAYEEIDKELGGEPTPTASPTPGRK